MRIGGKFAPGSAAVAFALAFLVTITYSRQAERTKVAESRRDQLATLVEARQLRATRLERDVRAMRSKAEDLRGGGGRRTAALQAEIERLGLLAGTRPLRGPGVVVTLGDSPLAEEEGSPDFLIQDVDLQLVVNELWNAGAEAIAINGQRIVSTSAIRSAGRSILVNYKVLTSPYRVGAIGDPAALRTRFDRSDLAERFKTWTQVYRLSIQIARRERVVVPGFDGAVRLTHATPAPTP